MENLCLNIASYAQSELELTERVFFRCVEDGAVFPAEWAEYRRELRPYLSGTLPGPLPQRPEYPA